MSEAATRTTSVSHDKYDRLIAAAQKETTIKVAVAHPCDEVSLRGVVEAMNLRLVDPILVGPVERVRAVAAQSNIDISAIELVNSEHSEDSAAKAVELVTEGKVAALMEGESSHGQTDGRCRVATIRHSDGPPDQPLLHHGRAGLFRRADH